MVHRAESPVVWTDRARNFVAIVARVVDASRGDVRMKPLAWIAGHGEPVGTWAELHAAWEAGSVVGVTGFHGFVMLSEGERFGELAEKVHGGRSQAWTWDFGVHFTFATRLATGFEGS